MNISKILSSKEHNPHYLKRYIAFVDYCRRVPQDGYCENHHICPKADDLFPEYSSFRKHEWNKLRVPYRHHFILHWLLWKTFGKSQMRAFYAMINRNSSKMNKPIKSSKMYEMLKIEAKNAFSSQSKGFAIYVDKIGNKVRCQTNDPRVLSGELISSSTGRKYEPRSASSKAKTKTSLEIAYLKKFPNRTVKLYRGIELLDFTYEKVNPNLLDEMIAQGWSQKKTKEYKDKYEPRKKRCFSEKARKQMSITRKGKKRKTIEQKREFKLKNGKMKWCLCYNIETKQFSTEMDFDIREPFVKVFSNAGEFYRAVSPEGKPCSIDSRCPLPENFFLSHQLKLKSYLNVETNTIEQLYGKDKSDNHILLKACNDNRIKIIHNGVPIYFPKDLFEKYGLPNKCTFFESKKKQNTSSSIIQY